jgi:predicted transcriptional regulator
LIWKKLARISHQRGCESRSRGWDAIERVVNCDDWFIGEVDKGLAEIDRGDVLTHEAVTARLEQRLAQKPPRR